MTHTVPSFASLKSLFIQVLSDISSEEVGEEGCYDNQSDNQTKNVAEAKNTVSHNIPSSTEMIGISLWFTVCMFRLLVT